MYSIEQRFLQALEHPRLKHSLKEKRLRMCQIITNLQAYAGIGLHIHQILLLAITFCEGNWKTLSAESIP